MSRSGRLLELVTLLGGRRARSIDEIVDRFDISERTAYRDLAELSAARIPVARDEHGYKLLDTATLRPLNLTAEEHALLRLALANPVLRRQPALARALETLQAKLDAVTARVEESAAALALAPVDRSGATTADVMSPLIAAVRARQPVEIEYASLSGGTHRRRAVDPWKVVQRGEAWYLVGRDHEADDVRIFRLDRIDQVSPVAGRFELPEGFDVEKVFAGTWRLFRGSDSFAVHLVFDARLAPLLRARHLPDEQVKTRRDGRIDYKARVNALEELARWIVGFGGGVEVRAPKALREMVERIAEGALRSASG